MAEIPFLKAMERLDEIDRTFASMRVVRDILDTARKAQNELDGRTAKVRELEASVVDLQAKVDGLQVLYQQRLAEIDTKVEQAQQASLQKVIQHRDQAVSDAQGEIQRVRDEAGNWREKLADIKRETTKAAAEYRMDADAKAVERARVLEQHQQAVRELQEEMTRLQAGIAALRQDHQAMIEAARAIIDKR